MSTSVPSAPSHYVFGELLIDGRWRAGAAGTIFKDLDPYTGRTLVEVPQANVADIDAAYASAKRAQRHWANTLPGQRAEVCAKLPRSWTFVTLRSSTG
nr:aldehyde dehydrogenase family protein [Caballeronia mineralivorans]